MKQYDCLKKNRKGLLIENEINLLNSEISLYKEVIESFPKGLVYNIKKNKTVNLYGISPNYNYARFMLDKKQVYDLVYEYNILVKRKKRLSKKLALLNARTDFIEKYEIDNEKVKIKK